jgi:glycerol-3-phosphate dehydrogenase
MSSISLTREVFHAHPPRRQALMAVWHAAEMMIARPPLPGSPDLHRDRRDHDLEQATRSVSDVLVIGGGITGSGIALDAASRGLSVTLVESRDLAYGTSRWSSKLIHGGLRYLAHGDVHVAWESARERHHLMTRIAPHLIRPLPHVLVHPRNQSRARNAVLRVGLGGADAMRRLAGTRRETLPGARNLSADAVMGLLPAIDRQRINGGVGYWDGQLIDDARLVISVARTAAAYGARIMTRMTATDVSRDEVVVRDSLSGQTHHLRARHVILAVGIWSGNWDRDLPIRLSRGTHVLLAPAALGNPRVALTVAAAEGKSRYVFALPQPIGPIIAGLTDVPADDASPDDTRPPQSDVDWVLDHLSTVLGHRLMPHDVVGAYSGYRPLVESPSHGVRSTHTSTADISRRHLVFRRSDGTTIVTGGKLTTYRKMAADAIDSLHLPVGSSRTATVGLVGSHPLIADGDPRLRLRYGSEAQRIANLAGEWNLPAQIPGTGGVYAAEIAHAIRHEGALTVDDIIQRRIRLSAEPDLLRSARPAISQLARALDPHIEVDEVDP